MVYLGADHAGFGLKKEIKQFFETCCIEYCDLGALEYDPEDDYPPFAQAVAEAVVDDSGSFGVLICGSGTGMVIAANKIKGIRAAFGFSEYAAKMAREDNNANVLTFSGRKQSGDEVVKMVKVFLETPFSTSPRHKRRIEELTELEGNSFGS